MFPRILARLEPLNPTFNQLFSDFAEAEPFLYYWTNDPMFFLFHFLKTLLYIILVKLTRVKAQVRP